MTHAKRNTINQKKQARKHESRSTCHRAADAKRSTNATMQETRCTKISSTQSLATKHGAYATPAPREIHPPTTHPHIHPHTHRHLNHQPPPPPAPAFAQNSATIQPPRQHTGKIQQLALDAGDTDRLQPREPHDATGTIKPNKCKGRILRAGDHSHAYTPHNEYAEDNRKQQAAKSQKRNDNNSDTNT